MNYEEITDRRDVMVVLDVRLDNIYAFKNFHVNLTYPKRIVGSSIKEEHLPDRPNFRYKKVNVIMGANASGKTTFGQALMKIFNFLDRKNHKFITEVISDPDKPASFSLDMASKANIFYRIECIIEPPGEEKHSPDNIHLTIRQETIRTKDSYESCVKRVEATDELPDPNYLNELDKLEKLDWLFEYPKDTGRILQLPEKDKRFCAVLENILIALDPSIQGVDISQEAEKTYLIRLHNKTVILQDGEMFTTNALSSGTKAGVEVARVVSALMQGKYTFFYCDEKFPYIHSEIEKAILSLMIEYVRPGDQLFFTTHNTDVLDMNLPKHTFTFLRKDVNDKDCPITCVDASSLLKRSTDSVKNAVENDLFDTTPSTDRILDITYIQ